MPETTATPGQRAPTPRQRARAATIADIKSAALSQLATHGSELSLRAIARDLGVVSSALYRYFPSRDDLLTALIVDAYDDLADALLTAQAEAPPAAPRTAWLRTTAALRSWALAQPHRFALVYGTPVPGYAAPADTIEPAGRVVRAIADVVGRAYGETGDAAPVVRGETTRDPDGAGSEVLHRQLEAVAAVLGQSVPPVVVARLTGAFAQLVGLLTLELGGHFVGGFEPADDLYAHLVADLADQLGLHDPTR